ncbi:MAG: glycosyltransferase family 39 protein [Pyrinomonadaceae bacterium]
MENNVRKHDFLKNPLIIACLIASVKILLFLWAGKSYGYFRDELYFLESTNHLALGYPDHSPLSIWIAWAGTRIFGKSLYAIHFLPALAGALKIILTGFLVREFGGKIFPTILACLSVLAAPVYLGIDSLMSMNAYEPIFWTGCVLSYIWAKNRGDSRFWLLFGTCAGLGLMNKHSQAFFGFSMVLGLLLTKDRKMFADKYLWLGGGIAFLMFLPNLIWQYQNDWATLELLRNVQESGKNVSIGPFEFFLQQILIMHPLTFPIWFGGLLFLFFDRRGKRFRALGLAYLILLAIMIILEGKIYYMAPVYPMLFAAGGVFWGNVCEAFQLGKYLKFSYPVLLIVGGAILAPIAMPILPVESHIAYRNYLGIRPPKTEANHEGPLSQIFGDMFGWEEMTARTAEVYNSLPAAEREKAAIFGGNYGEAGAIDFFGPKYGLPKAISPHQGYYLWGPRDYDGSIVVILGGKKEDAEKYCRSVEESLPVGHPYAMKYENFKILICRDLKEPFPEVWKKIKLWR